MKYFLYIRKSTDEDDRQVLSLEAQETELKEFALRENLLIAATFRESQTAKEPGRPIFNDMLKRMERGEAEGILAWHPDRLARNSVDGGRIIFLVDTGKIRSQNPRHFGLSRPRKANSCSISLLGNQNTLLIIFQRIPKEGCVKNCAEANCPVMLRWDI